MLLGISFIICFLFTSSILFHLVDEIDAILEDLLGEEKLPPDVKKYAANRSWHKALSPIANIH